MLENNKKQGLSRPKRVKLWLLVSFVTGVIFAYAIPTLFFRAMRAPIPELHKAARKGDFKEVQKLLQSGYPVDTIDWEWEDTALFEAARGGHIEIMKELLKYGANVNKMAWTGSTPLAEAYLGGNKEAIKILEERGATYDYDFMRLNYFKDKKLKK